MSKFLDETGLTHLVSKFDEKFSGMYVPRKEFDSFSTDINSQITDISSDINTAMYGPYSVKYATVQFTYGTGQISSVETKNLMLTDAMGDNAPRIYVIDLSLSQRASASLERRLNLLIGLASETDISSLSSTAGYQNRFNNLSGGIQRVVIRFNGSYNFLSDKIFISLTNGFFYRPYTINITEPSGLQSQTGYQMLGVKSITNNSSYVIIDFVGHGKPRLSNLTTKCYAVPQLVGCVGWLTNTLT